MFNILTDLANQEPEKSRGSQAGAYLEPHVGYFDIHSSEKELFILPFKIIGWSLLVFAIAGFVSVLVWEEEVVARIFFCMIALLGPFYLPGIYYYFSCYKKEVDTRIELDSKHGLIKYEKPGNGRNILFHESQIEKCTVKLSLLFPYKINYVSLQIKGGYEVNISSLVLEPQQLVQQFKLAYTLETYWFNRFPQKMSTAIKERLASEAYASGQFSPEFVIPL